jgi:hypothetical protein
VNGTIDTEVARYAGAVRAACADLPERERELLLEDLEDHLAEVAAEAGGPLPERLGRPEAYAAELRASAGLPAPGAGAGGRGPRRRLRESRAARRLGALWAAGLAHPAGRAVAGFLPELRPAWWVLRGYLAVQALSVALTPLYADDGLSFPLPQLFDSRVLGLLAVAAAVTGSVALGRRGAVTARGRGLTVVGNAVLAVFAVLLLTDVGANRYAADAYWDQAQYEGTYPSQYGLRSDGREISNIYPFDARGRPLRDVHLVDQDGEPLIATGNDTPELETRWPLDGHGDRVLHRYPRQQHWVDPGSGQREPVPAPRFRPPPTRPSAGSG